MLKLLLLCLISYAQSKQQFEDYCWRDYSGQAPTDALHGGLDRNGNPIFIGQALHNDKLIPGKILYNDQRVYYEWSDKESSSKENNKILCSNQPQKFVWIPTDKKGILNLTDKILINGGYEKKYSTYIGKVFTGGETLVGKIVCNKSKCYGLYTTKDGKVSQHSLFHVLTYNPDEEDVDNCQPMVDVRSMSE